MLYVRPARLIGRRNTHGKELITTGVGGKKKRSWKKERAPLEGEARRAVKSNPDQIRFSRRETRGARRMILRGAGRHPRETFIRATGGVKAIKAAGWTRKGENNYFGAREFMKN